MAGERPIVRYALLGGVITGATIGLPVLDLLNCACCAGVMLGGFLAVFFATRDELPGQPPLARTEALQLGVLSGLFGALAGTLLHGLVLLIAGDVATELLRSVLSDPDLSASLPPELTEGLEEMFRGQEGFSVLDILIHFLLWLVIAPLFGLVGGLLGYSMLKKDGPPQSFSPTGGITHP